MILSKAGKSVASSLLPAVRNFGAALQLLQAAAIPHPPPATAPRNVNSTNFSHNDVAQFISLMCATFLLVSNFPL